MKVIFNKDNGGDVFSGAEDCNELKMIMKEILDKDSSVQEWAVGW